MKTADYDPLYYNENTCSCCGKTEVVSNVTHTGWWHFRGYKIPSTSMQVSGFFCPDCSTIVYSARKGQKVDQVKLRLMLAQAS